MLINKQISKAIVNYLPEFNIQDIRFWLLSIVSGLATIHVTLVWQLTKSSDRLSITILIWSAILFLLWERRKKLRLKSEIIPSLLGCFLIVIFIFRSTFLLFFDQPFLRILPLVIFLSTALIASGIKELSQYWRELILISLLVFPEGIFLDFLERLPAIDIFTAKYATLLLWYSGFEVSRQGVIISLPTGAVEVYPGCSGLTAMVLLLKLTIVYLIIFPASFFKAVLLATASIVTVLLVNGFRIALLAVLVTHSNPFWFNYWHNGGGSQLFSVFSIIIFMSFCSFLTKSHEPKDKVFK
jgi:cyanoexosortase A